MSAEEEWRPVVGYEGRYEVSDLGRVRSLVRPAGREGLRRRSEPLMLKSYIERPHGDSLGGYPMVCLCRDSKTKSVRIHNLVASAFLGPRPTGLETRHLNGIKTDNRPSNLKYGTKSENGRDAVLHGDNKWAARTHCANGHPFTEDNTLIRTDSGRSRRCRICKRNYGRASVGRIKARRALATRAAARR